MNETPPWLTAREAARRGRVGLKTVYREVKAGRLRAAAVGGRRSLRFRAQWVDAWLEGCAPQENDVRDPAGARTPPVTTDV